MWYVEWTAQFIRHVYIHNGRIRHFYVFLFWNAGISFERIGDWDKVVSIVQLNCSCNYGFQRQGVYARRVKKLGSMEPRQAEALSRKAQGRSTAAPAKGRPVQSEMEIQRIIQSTMGFYVRIYFFSGPTTFTTTSSTPTTKVGRKNVKVKKTFEVACENRESGSRLKEEAPKCSEKV